MSGGPPFIDWKVFEEVISNTPAKDGSSYQDKKTIYGDMSRLVVARLATTPPSELLAKYHDLSWEGGASVRAMHEAARKWLREHHPERYERLCGK